MSVTIRDLLEAGAHFGHQTHRWNPKMKPYIFGSRNGIYIINLEKTKEQWSKAREVIVETISRGQKILFIGTKPQAQEIVKEEATRAKQYHVNKRWLGGMLTNFQTIKNRIDRMDAIQKIKNGQEGIKLSKKDMVELDKENEKLEKSLFGIKDMKTLPGLLLVIDPKKEHIAIKEANKLGIPVIAITDTNCNPDGVEYVVPSNDDALKAVRLFLQDAADACLEGEKKFEDFIQEQSKERLKAQAQAQQAPAQNVDVLSTSEQNRTLGA